MIYCMVDVHMILERYMLIDISSRAISLRCPNSCVCVCVYVISHRVEDDDHNIDRTCFRVVHCVRNHCQRCEMQSS